MKIKKLSEKVIKQIAAGEVIARPANAIKEIIENAIDAGSTNISIHVNKTGLERIVIIDNGCGMDKDDLELCTQLHTTSKTSEKDHMFGTSSLGFRGEALASINEISDMTIESNGYKLHKNNITHSNIESGTRIEILNMFANVSARLKFLKSSQVEWFHIKWVLEKFMISECNITWKIFHNEKKLWHLEAGETQVYRIEKLLGSNAYPFSHEYNNIKISGYILDISARNFNALFINRRSVRDKAIAQYMRNIFSEYYMKNENPGYIMNIEIDPMMVDCNVHPAKEEVRIINHADIFAMLSFVFSHQFFAKALNKEQTFQVNTKTEEHENEYKLSFDSPKFEMPEITNRQFVHTKFDQKETNTRNEKINFVNETNTYTYQTIKANEQSTNNWKKHKPFQTPSVHRIIGQIRNSFIMFETEDGIGIFDQHAAHERHVYEKMKKELSTGNSQQLLIPIEINLTPLQAEYLIKNQTQLENKGIRISWLQTIESTQFETDCATSSQARSTKQSQNESLLTKSDYANTTILKASNSAYKLALTHIPQSLPALDCAKFIETELEENCNIETLIDRLVADIACKNALKANTQLSIEQMYALMETALENVPICNHGRPVFKYFTHLEIENWFRRK